MIDSAFRVMIVDQPDTTASPLASTTLHVTSSEVTSIVKNISILIKDDSRFSRIIDTKVLLTVNITRNGAENITWRSLARVVCGSSETVG